MIAAATYSVFNGEELLLGSLRQVRPHLDYINLVWQLTSHSGEVDAKPTLWETVSQALDDRLVDEIMLYVRDPSLNPWQNELVKRQMGMDACVAAEATHAMTMDCDEYWDSEQFGIARNVVEQNDAAGAGCGWACPSFFYVKRPIYRSKLHDKTWVPFLSRIMKLGTGSSRNLDPSRQMGYHAPLLNTECHNFNLVRRDIRHKLVASPNAGEWTNRVLREYEQWEFPQPWMGQEMCEVEDHFGIEAML